MTVGETSAVECPFCSTLYRAHPFRPDHRDVCDLNPLNRPHIIGTANAPGVDLSLAEGSR